MAELSLNTRVDKSGKQVEKEDCVYHWGRLYRKRGNRGEYPTEGDRDRDQEKLVNVTIF